MTNPRQIRKTPITWTFNSGDSLWYSQVIEVSAYRDIDITAAGTGNIQVLATKELNNDLQNIVDFQSASTIDNSYAAIVIADETIPNTYVTTLTVTPGATKLGEINTNLVTYVCLTRTVDTVDAFLTYCDNS